MYESDNIWDYISEDGKILDKKMVLKLLPDADPWDIQEIAGTSEEGRKIIRVWVESNYKKLMREKPDSFFAGLAKKDYYKAKSVGEDPFDYWYKIYNDKKTKSGSNFLSLLASMLRIFA